MNKKVYVAFAILLCAICVCGTGRQAQAVSKKIGMKSSTVKVYVGGKKKIAISGNKKGLKWRSSNKKIATVSASGIVKGRKLGMAKVYVTNRYKKKASCKVKVGKYVTGITMKSGTNVIVEAGETSQIRYQVKPSKVYDTDVTYTSLNKSIATVSSRGKITGRSAGITKIRMKTKGVNKKKKKLSKTLMVCITESTEPDLQTPVVEIVQPTPQTIEEVIAGITPPAANQLVAARLVVSYVTNGVTQVNTLYFLNKNYTGAIQLTFNGKTVKSEDNVTSLLNILETTKRFGGYNTAKTIRVDRPKATETVTDPAWVVKDLTVTPNLQVVFNGYQNDKKYKTPYGLVVSQGDTSGIITFS